MSKENDSVNRSAGFGVFLFVLGLLIAIIAGTVTYATSIVLSILVILVGVNLCFLGIRTVSKALKKAPARK